MPCSLCECVCFCDMAAPISFSGRTQPTQFWLLPGSEQENYTLLLKPLPCGSSSIPTAHSYYFLAVDTHPPWPSPITANPTQTKHSNRLVAVIRQDYINLISIKNVLPFDADYYEQMNILLDSRPLNGDNYNGNRMCRYNTNRMIVNSKVQ